jgi:cell division protein FtsW
MRLITFSIIILVVFGLMMLASASSHLGKTSFNNSYYFLTHQLLNGLVVGVIGFLVAAFFPYRRYRKLAFWLLLLNVALLALVFTPLGVTAKNASRWLSLGPVSFQPSELLKITYILYLAAWLSGRHHRRHDFWSGALPFSVVTGVVAGLLFLQPATSTVAILIATGFLMYFASGAKIRYLLAMAIGGIVVFGAVVYLGPTYRLERLQNFLNPESNVLSGNYQLNQSLIAIGSGGIMGVGYGKSTTKIHYLPEPAGDSIFAVIAEEFGFIGSILLIGVFASLVIKLLLTAKSTRDRFGSLLLVGFGSLIGIQAFVNIAAISGLIPLTGVPLPFISYGGTALAVFMTIGGISVNVLRTRQR